jgi:hypothetical protein
LRRLDPGKRSASSLAVAILVLFPCALLAEQPFAGIGAAEAAALARGEPLVRNLRSARELAGGAPEAERIKAEAQALGPNYVAELLALVPREGSAAAIDSLEEALLDVEGYVGIPYYSVQNKRTFDLFSSMRILSRSAAPGEATRIDASQVMLPFGEYRASYELQRSGETLRFKGANTGPISYNGVAAVKPGQMLWFVTAFPAGEYWAFYGVGAARAFDMFGALRGRLEASFVGRVQAFFRAMQSRMGAR